MAMCCFAVELVALTCAGKRGGPYISVEVVVKVGERVGVVLTRGRGAWIRQSPLFSTEL